MISSDMSTVDLTCGCGRAVPPTALQAATALGKGKLTCSVCGAQASLNVLLKLRVGRELCGRCGSIKCPDGCCCAC